jgi:hypothetical protein
VSTDNALLTAVSLIAAKAETTTGNVIATGTADAATICMNAKLEPDDNSNPRMNMGGEGTLQSTPGAQSGSASWDNELTGNGATGQPLYATLFFPACDFTNTAGTFARAKDNTTLTISKYEDGLLRTLYGSKGSWKLTIEEGKPPTISWSWKGKYIKGTDAAILTPTLPTVLADVDKTTVTIGSFSPLFSKLVLDCGNDVQLREDAGNVSGDNSGIHSAVIVNHAATLTIDSEATATSTHDWRAKILASTEETLTITIGLSANRIITIVAPKAQAIKCTRGDRHGIMTDEVTLQLNGSADFSIAFS